MTNELYHHGVRGQKWHVRRWQNEDGSLTPAGRIHYGYGTMKMYTNPGNPRFIRDVYKYADSDLNVLRRERADRIEKIKKDYGLTEYREKLKSLENPYKEALNKKNSRNLLEKIEGKKELKKLDKEFDKIWDEQNRLLKESNYEEKRAKIFDEFTKKAKDILIKDLKLTNEDKKVVEELIENNLSSFWIKYPKKEQFV